MTKFLFRRLLASHYSAVRWMVNKKMPENIIPTTVHFFLSEFSFLAAGLVCVILGTINYKFKYPEFFLMVIVIIIGFGLQKATKKAIYKWGIEKEYKTLPQEKRFSRITFAFIFFWSCFAVFFYLGVKFLGGYSVQ